MSDEWPVLALRDVAIVNPKEPPLPEDSPFVTMADVSEWGRWASSSGPRGSRGGCRARSGDTLMARITPCLENGKIAMVPSELSRIGGSTEFIVLRAGPGLLPEFLFLWAVSGPTHHAAVDLMVGTSGRQRVSGADLAALPISVPPLAEQRRIVDLVGAIDEHLRALAAEIEALTLVLKSVIEDWQALNEDEMRLPALGDLAVIRSGPSWAAAEERAIPSDGATRVIKITNTKPDGSLDLTGRTYVTGLPARTLLLDDRSLIVIRTNGNRDRIGNVYRPSPGAFGCAVSAFQFIVQATDDLARDRIYWALRAPSAQAAMSEAASGTTGLGNLAAGWLKVRPIAELNDHARLAFEDTDRQLSLLRNEHEGLGVVRTQLLQALLSREVAVPEAYDLLLDAGVA